MASARLVLALALVALATCDDQWFGSQDYQAQSAALKIGQLWDQIVADRTPLGFYSALTTGGILLESMDPTFDHTADTFPDGRKKLIHTVGVVAKANFVVQPDTGYTGIFASGADHMLIRMSSAKSYDSSKTSAAQAEDNFTPGIAVKFLRDGVPSGNTVAMFGVNGFPSWNFFGRDFSNHIPGASGLALKTLACKFSSATDYIQTMSLSDIAKFDQQGNSVATAKYPWRLIFRPNPQLHNAYSDDFIEDYKDQLSAIPQGTLLYDVLAVDDPSVGCEKKIGSIVTTSEITTSHWGDEKLFFQHARYEVDLAENPAWKTYAPLWHKWTFSSSADKPEATCPFAWMWKN